jgi:prevent-host-death family protein
MKNGLGHKEVAMKQMRASVFKARCLSVIREIQATGEPVLVTKRGKPVVKVVPVESEKDNLFGFMAGEFKISGDIESPVWPLKQRDVLSRRTGRTKPQAKSRA